jgi:phage terminase large subunit GpA-like protein
VIASHIDTAKPLAVLERIREAQGNELRLALRRAFARAYAPPPKMPLDLWADKYRILSPEAASMPGRWRTDAEPMARGPMRAATDPLVEKMTGMMAAQVLKTEFVLNLIGYYAHGEPGPMLTVYPTVEGAEMFSKERLAPLIRDTPVLRKVFTREKERASDSTIRQKSFVGGRLSMVGANAPAGLASRPIRFVLCDEVDRFPASAGGDGKKSEGDPIGLAEERTSTFPNRKIVLVSTPTVKGFSRIEDSFLEGDQRRFYVPCPHCGVRQVIEWAGVKWDKGEDGEPDPSTARYVCRVEANDPLTGELGCGKPWSEAQRVDAIQIAGKLPDYGWIAAKPFKGHASFHASQLSSKRVPLSQVVKKFVEAKGSFEKLKKWTNLSLAETWEEGGAKADPDTLYGRREPYDATTMLPPEVGLITAGIDIQRNRWECETLGWGKDEECWSLTYRVHFSDPSTPEYWQSLDEHLRRTFPHPTGAVFAIEAACVDSSDNTQRVYDFCRPRFSRRIFPIKGRSNSIGHPIWPKKATRNADKKIDVFLLGLDNAKADMQSRLMLKEPGPAYCHFPILDEYDENYFIGLTIEKAVTKYRFGVPSREWHCPDGGRNEPWDCRIYAYAALKSLAVDVSARIRTLWAQAAARAASPNPSSPPKIAGKRRGARSRGVEA